jgi:hypothetical protein
MLRRIFLMRYTHAESIAEVAKQKTCQTQLIIDGLALAVPGRVSRKFSRKPLPPTLYRAHVFRP